MLIGDLTALKIRVLFSSNRTYTRRKWTGYFFILNCAGEFMMKTVVTKGILNSTMMMLILVIFASLVACERDVCEPPFDVENGYRGIWK